MPTVGVDGPLDRRRFLQLALAAGTAAALPWTIQSSSGAAAAGAQRVLVVVQLLGGNDGTSTVVPSSLGLYRDRYGPLAVSEADVLPLGDGVGLHPSLAQLKARFDAGDVAVVRGAGDPRPTLSHFQAASQWMSGWSTGPAATGWVGRALASLGNDALAGVVVGDQLPHHFTGPTVPAVVVPTSIGNAVGWLPPDPARKDTALVELLERVGVAGNDRGGWFAAWDQTLVGLVALGRSTSPAYTDEATTDPVVNQLRLAARLVNLDIGIRALGVSMGGFDTHGNQGWHHPALLARLDQGLDSFFRTLDPARAGQVVVMTMSEFGRRPMVNSSGGTDHGGASSLFVLGSGVRGGLYGASPSFRDLDGDGNLRTSVDFRSVYASVLDGWLGVDSAAVIGGRYENLALLEAPSGP